MTSLSTPTLTSDSSVSVDWARLSSVISGTSREATPDDVLLWIKTSPLRTRLRVHLRQSIEDRRHNHPLRRTLQSLGCTVTSLTSLVADR